MNLYASAKFQTRSVEDWGMTEIYDGGTVYSRCFQETGIIVLMGSLPFRGRIETSTSASIACSNRAK